MAETWRSKTWPSTALVLMVLGLASPTTAFGAEPGSRLIPLTQEEAEKIPFVALDFDFDLSLAWRLALLLGLALAPLVLLLRHRRAVLAAQGEERLTAWFGYWRLFRAAFQGAGLLWPILVLTLRLDEACALAASSTLGRIGLQLALLALPPSALYLLGNRLSWPVVAHVRELSRSREELNREAWGTLLTRIVPLSLLALMFVGKESVGWIYGLPIAALLISLLGRMLWLRATNFYPQAVTTGPFRDRVFELAQKGKARLTQLFVVPAARTRLANAFAVTGNQIYLTDYLLSRLSRRESEAVVAHELSHLRSRHLTILSLALTGPMIVLILLRQQPGLLGFFVPVQLLRWLGAVDLWSAISPWPLLVLLLLLPLRFVSRRIERSADAGAARLTGDPEAMISALGKLARLNLLPLHWGRIAETLSTHPAMNRRAQALAERFDVPSERAEALLSGEAEIAGPAWEVPAAEVAAERLFTTRFKARIAIRTGLVTLAVIVGTVVAGAWWLGRHSAHGRDLVLGLAWIGLAAWALAVLASNFASLPTHRDLRRRLAEALRREGIDIEAGGGILAGFAPHGEPRIYEGYAIWDVGFLFPGTEELVWIGDRLRFRLRRGQVDAIRLGPGQPHFWPLPNVYLDWRDEEGRSRQLYLRAGAGSLVGVRRETRRLFQQLTEEWQPGRAPALRLPALETLPAPITDEVTSSTLRESLRLRPILTAAWFYFVVTGGLCLALGVGEPMPLAMLLSPAVMLALFLPNVLARFRRKPRPKSKGVA